MSDLISRSELLKSIDEEAKKIPIDAEKYHIDTNIIDGMNATLKAITNIIKEQPTAYDVDKVVAELKKAKSVNVDIGFGTVIDTLRKDVVLEIVKQGGVSDDVCEWHKVKNGNAYKSTTHAEIHDSRVLDWCRCPYCGKKIKVVDNDK